MRMLLLKSALGFLLLSSSTLPSAAQELVNEQAARKLVELPASERQGFVAITDVEFSRDGKRLAIGASDGMVRVLRIDEGSLAQLVTQVANPVRKLAFSPDGKLLASATYLQVNFAVLDQLAEQLENDNLLSLKGSGCVTFSPDGKLVAIGNYRGAAAVIEVMNGKCLFAIEPFAGTGPVDTGLYKPNTIAMDFSPDGNLLAVTTDFFDDELPSFRNVQVGDVKTGRLRFFFHGVSCGFSPAGDLLAYRSAMSEGDGRIVLLDINTFLPAGVLTSNFQDACFAPDGRSMAGIARQHVELWTIPSQDERTRNCKRIAVLQHAANVTCIAFAPDANSLITGDAEGNVRVWNVSK